MHDVLIYVVSAVCFAAGVFVGYTYVYISPPKVVDSAEPPPKPPAPPSHPDGVYVSRKYAVTTHLKTHNITANYLHYNEKFLVLWADDPTSPDGHSVAGMFPADSWVSLVPVSK